MRKLHYLKIVVKLAFFLPCFLHAEDTFHLRVIHTNDVHSRVLPIDKFNQGCLPEDAFFRKCFGGASRRQSAIQKARSSSINSVLLDAGDQFQGSVFFYKYHGKEASILMNKMGYDAMTLGNHEFDLGPKVLSNFIADVHFPILSANIDSIDDEHLSGMIVPYTIISFGSNKVGVIGVSTEETDIVSAPGKDVIILPIKKYLKKAIAKLQMLQVNKIILLSHAGISVDIDLAKNISGIDIIVSGHTHTFLSNTDFNAQGPYPLVINSQKGKEVLIVSAFAYGKYLGVIDLEFDSHGKIVSYHGEPELLDESVKDDQEVSELVSTLYGPLKKEQNTIVGFTEKDLDGDDKSCRHRECEMGNIISDAMLGFAGKEKAEIAIYHGGGIRAGLSKGKISLAELIQIFPFSHQLITFSLKGEDLISVLEHGVSKLKSKNEGGNGRFLQVAGLKFTVRLSNRSGNKIHDVMVRQENGRYQELKKDQVYKIVSNDYIYNGGDGFAFIALKSFNGKLLSKTVRDIFIEYLQQCSHKSSALGHRIKLVS